MRSCTTCEYGAGKGYQYIVCKYFNRVMNLKLKDGCPSHKLRKTKLK